jgi:hypothetical protein
VNELDLEAGNYICFGECIPFVFFPAGRLCVVMVCVCRLDLSLILIMFGIRYEYLNYVRMSAMVLIRKFWMGLF